MPVRLYLAILFLLFQCGLHGTASASVSRTIPFQGVLTTPAGVPLNGVYSIQFTLYDGSGTSVWTETKPVSVDKGRFSVTLGTLTAISAAVNFSEPLALGIKVANDPEMAPRMTIGAVPVALSLSLPSELTLNSGSRALTITNSGSGGGILASSGGSAVWGITSSSSGAGVIGDNTDGEAVVGRSRGGVGVGAVVGRSDGAGAGVRGFNASTGTGVLGQAGIGGGTGQAARFENVNATNGTDVVYITGNGSGDSLVVNQGHASGSTTLLRNIAVFQSGGTRVARIDKLGRGYFNGGTQASGADVAEAFAVVGHRDAYEPGDVLVISPDHRRTVEKCSEAYSSLVSGVVATRPGVTLTERDVNADLSDLVLMGVIGVVPTKVSVENGAIRAGDMLVTSTKPGMAMKGTDRSRMLGAILGKALEPFDGPGEGLIQVLVTMK